MRQACRLLAPAQLAELLRASRTSPRRRAHNNFHPQLVDPIQRFFNCLQPGSYVRPHRHAFHRFELFVLLSGQAGILTFEEGGRPCEHFLLAPEAALAVEIPGGVTHTVLALEEDTLLFEVKPGPYDALTDKDFASWAPPEGDPSCAWFLAQWERLFLAGDPAGCSHPSTNSGPKGCT